MTPAERGLQLWKLANAEPAGIVDSGHHGAVTSFDTALLDDAHIVVTGGADGKVAAWNLTQRRCISGPTPLHAATVAGVGVTQLNGRTVAASAAADGTLCLLDLETGEAIGQPLELSAGVDALVLGELHGTPIGVAQLSNRAGLGLWDLPRHTVSVEVPDQQASFFRFGGTNAIAVGTLGGSEVVVTGHGALRAAPGIDPNQRVRIWRLPDLEPIGDPLEEHRGAVTSVAIGSVGGRDVVASGSLDGTVLIWEPSEGSFHRVRVGSAVHSVDVARPDLLLVGAANGFVVIDIESTWSVSAR